MISSRKQAHVDNAVDQLSKEGLSVTGVPCHVGDTAQRANLFKVGALWACQQYLLLSLSFELIQQSGDG